MRKYEIIVIVDPDVDERQVPTLIDKHLKTITTGNGTVESTNIWGKRRLAYEINKKSEGIYAVIDLKAEPASVKELDRQLTLNESVVRTKVLRPESSGSAAS